MKWGNTLDFLYYQCRYYQKEIKLNSHVKVKDINYILTLKI